MLISDDCVDMLKTYYSGETLSEAPIRKDSKTDVADCGDDVVVDWGCLFSVYFLVCLLFFTLMFIVGGPCAKAWHRTRYARQ